MLKKLRLKLICVTMALVTAMTAIVFVLIYDRTKTDLENENIHMLQQLATDPYQLSTSQKWQYPCFAVQVNHQGYLIVFGKSYYSSDKDFLEELYHEVYLTGRSVGVLEQYDLRFYRRTRGFYELVLFGDMTSELSTLRSLRRNFIILGSGAFLGFLVITILISRWMVKPVDKAWQQQRQFVSDASHELKTPLTVIMTNAEMLESGEYTDEKRTVFADSILTMSHHMRELVERLLELARIDNGHSRMVFTEVDLSGLSRDCILPFEPVFYEKGLHLECAVEPDILVSGDRQYLCQLVDILLDNAQKYSAPGGVTTLSLRKKYHNKCLLSVSDPGEAMSPEELKAIFRRFYRADEARERDGSFGLGLSIAESIVQEHHGHIWAESKNGFNTFFAEFPTVKGDAHDPEKT